MGDRNTVKNEKHRHKDTQRHRERERERFRHTVQTVTHRQQRASMLYRHIIERSRKQKLLKLSKAAHPPKAPAEQLLSDFVNFRQAELQCLSHSQNIMTSSVSSVMQTVCTCLHPFFFFACA